MNEQKYALMLSSKDILLLQTLIKLASLSAPGPNTIKTIDDFLKRLEVLQK